VRKIKKEEKSLYERIFDVILKIPKGKVATYGQIGMIVGTGARTVGYAMHSIKEGSNLPWFRVINSKGEISIKDQGGYEFQRKILESEGIEFNEKSKIDLKKYLWKGPLL